MARRLVRLGWEIVATGEAADVLGAADVSAVKVEAFNGITESFPFPATLHPRMERALTMDVAERIDLVFDIPYPLEEGDDVGGWTLLALAAKGKRIPVASCEDMEEVLGCLEKSGAISDSLQARLSSAVHFEIARHHAALVEDAVRPRYVVPLSGTRRLASGENPYQQPSWMCEDDSTDPWALPAFEQVAGDPPCFTNLADMDALLETMCRLSLACQGRFGRIPHVVVAGKHGNPCGIGVSDEAGEALDKALWGHPQAIWGGELVTNFPLTSVHAATLLRSDRRQQQLGNAYWMLHLVAAPAIDVEAVRLLSKNPDRKLMVNPALASPHCRSGVQFRMVRGGALVQPVANYVLDLQALEWPIASLSTAAELDLLIAWAAAYTANIGGNEIAIAQDGQLIGIGGGPSTVDAAHAAVDRARRCAHDTVGSAFAADAFLPATDAAQVLCDAGVASGIIPGGGKQEEDVYRVFAGSGVCVGRIADDFRGFCRH